MFDLKYFSLYYLIILIASITGGIIFVVVGKWLYEKRKNDKK